MNRRITRALWGGILTVLFAVPAIHAQTVSNQATQVIFNQPVRIPGHTLSAGTYWFTVDDNGPNAILNTTTSDKAPAG